MNYYISLENVEIASQLCNVLIFCGFDDGSKNKSKLNAQSATTCLLVKSSQYLTGILDFETLTSLLENIVSTTQISESALNHALNTISNFPENYFTCSSKLPKLIEHLYTQLQKVENSSRKKQIFSSLIKLSFFDVEFPKIFKNVLEKIKTENDIANLVHLGQEIYEILEKIESLQVVPSGTTVNSLSKKLYQLIKESNFGKSKIQQQQAAIILSFCKNLKTDDILSNKEAISLYTKYLYQDGLLEDISIKALSKFKDADSFSEDLSSGIKLMPLPKEAGPANTVLFLRDLINICESENQMAIFLDLLAVSKSDDPDLIRKNLELEEQGWNQISMKEERNFFKQTTVLFFDLSGSFAHSNQIKHFLFDLICAGHGRIMKNSK